MCRVQMVYKNGLAVITKTNNCLIFLTAFGYNIKLFTFSRFGSTFQGSHPSVQPDEGPTEGNTTTNRGTAMAKVKKKQKYKTHPFHRFASGFKPSPRPFFLRGDRWSKPWTNGICKKWHTLLVYACTPRVR